MSSASRRKAKVLTAVPEMSDSYDNIRSAVLATGDDARVEVNQRALIDKILARYASAGAVYRELLQNSNDAEASTAQIHFKTSTGPKGSIVDQVVYKNDGLPFRPQDWSRLRKIAEGNPDVRKVGAFGVGAYTMFSICEEPMVVSGGQAMAFAWKGDALWVKVGDAPGQVDKWTSFVLRSRDPYPLPDLVAFGQFLCSSLTFTACLKHILVFVDGINRLTISKRQVQQPRIVTPPKASSWWSGDGAVTNSPKRIFSLGRSDGAITETMIEMSVDFDGDTSKKRARYVSAIANTRVPYDMARRMERVTKKRPPSEVKIEIFIDADSSSQGGASRKGSAAAITDAFSPGMGAGRVFIGFKTSQTTGLAAHLAAPLLPTVEREAIDFQDPTLRVYNCELLSIAGILMRLTLEHSMSLVGEQYAKTETERIAYEVKQKKEHADRKREDQTTSTSSRPEQPTAQSVEEEPYNAIFSFAKFMSSGVKKIAHVISSVDFMRDDDADLLNPSDSRPLSDEEKHAILLMKSFSPQQSTPDAQVGMLLAKGFEMCLPGLSPLVLTTSGIVRGLDSRLPSKGIESFVKTGVVRKVILKNAETYLLHVAGCRSLNVQDLIIHLRSNALDEDDTVRLLKWWTKYFRAEHIAPTQSKALKDSISLTSRNFVGSRKHDDPDIAIPLRHLKYYMDSSIFASDLPMPSSVLPKDLSDKLPERVLMDKSLSSWFEPLPLEFWVIYIADHPCLTDGKAKDAILRLRILAVLSREHSKLTGERRLQFEKLMSHKLSGIRCIPVEGQSNSACETDFPPELYLSSAELGIFHGLGSFRTVSAALSSSEISEEFLVTLGVRKTISIDFLFSQLDHLKWNRNPKPLIEFLRTTSLTEEDLDKLKTMQYLPEVNDKTRTYAPSELYLPNPDVLSFPFVKMLQWPSGQLHEESPDALFLKKVGCRVDPPLQVLMKYLTSDIKHQGLRQRGTEFLYKRLAAGGPYKEEYGNYLDEKFLPATMRDPFQTGAHRIELHAPSSCYSNNECSSLGFPILHSSLNKGKNPSYQQVFRCATRPHAGRLVHQLLTLVADVKRTEAASCSSDRVVEAFEEIFSYMSSRSMELDQAMIDTLSRAAFIPQWNGEVLAWCRPNEIYFGSATGRDSDLTSDLFFARKFSPFLATVGVKSEPSTEDIFRLLLSSPQEVLQRLGSESKYCSLLRRIAANPPYSEITSEIKDSPFLLAFRLGGNQEGVANLSADHSEGPSILKHTLAKARDICIIDNSSFSRMFSVLAAPQESDIEEFYQSLGSRYMSKMVSRRFFAEGLDRRLQNTELTKKFGDKIRERRPLLVSSVVSRQLLSDAAALLSDDSLEVYEVSKIRASYAFGNQQKQEYVTCSAHREPTNLTDPSFGSQQNGGNTRMGEKHKLYIFITQELDWFHVGNALGSVILKRCNVQDAFFIGSLLETPLNQLRARGFPVDRILRVSVPIGNQNGRTEQNSMKPKNERLSEPPSAVKSAHPKDSGSDDTGAEVRDKSRSGVDSILPDGAVVDRRQDDEEEQAPVKPKSKNWFERLRKRARPGQGSGSADAGVESQDKSQSSADPSPPHRSIHGDQGLRGKSRSEGLPSIGLKSEASGKTSGGIRSRPDIHISGGMRDNKDDAAYYKTLEKVMRRSVKSTRPVSSQRMTGSITVNPVPAETGLVDTVDGICEDVAEDLVPFEGPLGTSKTVSGMQVFSSRTSDASDGFLAVNWRVVESFEAVLRVLCEVYSLRVESVAIFHNPRGKVIAFNAARTLFFNVRVFANLHCQNGVNPGIPCYAFWFSVMAHELAHNLFAEHQHQHGFLTECYTHTYLPKLFLSLKSLGL